MIEQLKQYRLLLSILLLLVAMKFIIVPIFTWQNEQVTAIEQIQKRLAKAENLKRQQKELDVANKKAMILHESYEKLYFDWQDPSKFKIDKQKLINQWLTDRQLTTINVGWQPSVKFESAGIHREQMRVNISGKVNNLGAFLTQLESYMPIIAIEYFDMNIRGLNVEETGSAEVSLLLSFYMQDEAKNE